MIDGKAGLVNGVAEMNSVTLYNVLGDVLHSTESALMYILVH